MTETLRLAEFDVFISSLCDAFLRGLEQGAAGLPIAHAYRAGSDGAKAYEYGHYRGTERRGAPESGPSVTEFVSRNDLTPAIHPRYGEGYFAVPSALRRLDATADSARLNKLERLLSTSKSTSETIVLDTSESARVQLDRWAIPERSVPQQAAACASLPPPVVGPTAERWICPNCLAENRDDYHRISCGQCHKLRPTKPMHPMLTGLLGLTPAAAPAATDSQTSPPTPEQVTALPAAPASTHLERSSQLFCSHCGGALRSSLLGQLVCSNCGHSA